jgi:coenzyme F420 biosynthesis associated uncharacterized protein
MSAELVDWDLAVATARRLTPPGPQLASGDAAEVVDQLRLLAHEADGHVQAYTQLRPTGVPAPVAVVDRSAWSRSNVEGLRRITGPLTGALADREPGRVSLAVGRRITGMQVGAALAFLSSKVLGQYEPFADGQLLLVAPNIVAVEQRLAVDPHDFRLWVCVHEQTHRIQFTGVPWLRGHLENEIAAFVQATDLDPTAMVDRMRSAMQAVRRPGVSLMEALQTPAQRAVLDRLQALMSLVEGHADQVMDAVGPMVIPSVEEIRARFETRRVGGSPLDRFVRRLLGLDLKLQQYRQGGAFVRAVVASVGVPGFNEVWKSPETVPTLAEIADPDAWMDRVLGPGHRSIQAASA